MHFTIEPAVRHARKARIAIAGPSGCGKTWTALEFGSMLGERMVCIDTERASAALYAGTGPGEFQFAHLHNMPSYEPDALVAALHQCASMNFDVVIIDSLTHFWSGVGGVLEQVDKAARRNYSGNNFAGWKDVRPVERRMIDAMVSYPGHVIVTMRTKTEWVIEDNDRGRKTPKKIGTKPEQREGIEYEFDLVADMDIEHTLVVTKSRCRLLSDAVIAKPDGRVAVTLRDWLASGAPVPEAPPMPPAAPNGHATGAANGNGHAPTSQRQYSQETQDWFAWMRSQIANAQNAATLESLAALAEEGCGQHQCLEVLPAMRSDIDQRRAQLAAPVDPDILRAMHIRLTNRGLKLPDDRRTAIVRIIGHDVETSKALTLAETLAVIAEAENAEGIDLTTGEVIPEGAGVHPGEAVNTGA